MISARSGSMAASASATPLSAHDLEDSSGDGPGYVFGVSEDLGGAVGVGGCQCREAIGDDARPSALSSWPQ